MRTVKLFQYVELFQYVSDAKAMLFLLACDVFSNKRESTMIGEEQSNKT